MPSLRLILIYGKQFVIYSERTCICDLTNLKMLLIGMNDGTTRTRKTNYSKTAIYPKKN